MDENTEKRVVVLMPKDMVDFLTDKAKESGVGNISAYLRMMVRKDMAKADA